MDSSREQMFTSVEKTTHGTNKQRVLILALVVGVGTFAIGILIGRFATCPKSEPEVSKQSSLPNVIDLLGRDEDASIISEVIDEISSENIRDHVRTLAKYPHIAGMETSHELARMLKGFWENAGLDHVTLTPYNVLLSYPNMSDLNFVALLDENNNTVYKSNLTEAILTAEENTTNVVPPFNAFSYPGDIKGDIVYVNYGREEDFEYIEKNASISVAGKIVMARYGKIFRGDKVRLSEMRGAIGVILFSDPADYTNGDINQVYPNDWWLPPSGAQRGTVYIGVGDPLTADYPAIGTANRKLDPSNYLPSIPVHPIGYGIAIHLMRSLSGPEVNVTWRGLMNTTYRFGGGFKTTGWKARIHVSTSNGRVDVFNAIGIMRGEIEPDRYVLVGNHRDAWVFGAVDPGSGTAVMMEMSRVLGNLVKSGRWRPRRSILFCSWGAEEYGLVGSTEWVEHYTKTLGARAIAYLNLDVVVQGNFSLLARGTPMIHNSLFAATKMVPNPNSAEFAAGRKSVYDTWLMASPGKRGIPSSTKQSDRS
ncbi:hypothetical protein DPMN_095530 [Dreissena polymorpha]|uniref:Uncharacterized protein n=1 Tax=Dreissena polymorpha TaxID=45954 RepID=A0A9D4R3W8_DREPO|nr:hypothetical protein DPMN_095530 [Dreissena polymorpha]